MKVNEISQIFDDCLKRLVDDYSKHAWDSQKETHVRYWSEADIELWLATYCIKKFGENNVHIEVTMPRTEDKAKEIYGMSFDHIRGKIFDLIIADPYKFGEKFDLVAEIKWLWFHREPTKGKRKYWMQKVRKDLEKLAHMRKYCKLAYSCIIDEGEVLGEEVIKKWQKSKKYSGIEIRHLPVEF